MINIGILGYGNLGRGVELALKNDKDVNLVGVFTRRDPSYVKTTFNTKVYHVDELMTKEFMDKIDCLINCGGSATDLPVSTPKYSEFYNMVDSYDNHKEICNHLKNVNEMALLNNHTSIISVGWDPGLFSINRCYAKAILPIGKTYTFWGKGVSQGHSDAVRRIDGVIDARQYTVPRKEAIEAARRGEDLTTRDKHLREVYVVVKEGANKEEIKRQIITMPGYFADYDTTVHFISMEEMKEKHSKLNHGGFVLRSGKSNLNDNHHLIEYRLSLDSNPEFTSMVLVTYAKACVKMNKAKLFGAKTVLDVPPIYLLNEEREEIIKELL